MINVVDRRRGLTIAQIDQVTHSLENVALGKHGILEWFLNLELVVELETPNLRKIVTLRIEEQIIKEVTKQIEKLEEGKPVALTMQLSYISTEDDEQTQYIPGVVVAVRDNQSGVIFTTNIAD